MNITYPLEIVGENYSEAELYSMLISLSNDKPKTIKSGYVTVVTGLYNAHVKNKKVTVYDSPYGESFPTKVFSAKIDFVEIISEGIRIILPKIIVIPRYLEVKDAIEEVFRA